MLQFVWQQIQILEELSAFGVVFGHDTDVDKVQEILRIDNGQYEFFYVAELASEIT